MAPSISTEQTKKPLDQAIRRGLAFAVSQQYPDGSWRGEYGGPMFLLPMYIATAYICRRAISEPLQSRMKAYLFHTQNPDGSFGLHTDATEGSMFTTVLSYVAMRMLHVPPDHKQLIAARQWIQDNGTVLGTADWGKWILVLLSLYKYDGLHPVLPELWLLPYRLPFHPGRFWCHARQVYLPMSYLYGIKAQVPADDLIQALRTELYDRPFETIPFHHHRNTVAPCDRRTPQSWLLSTLTQCLGWYERRHSVILRKKALDTVFTHIDYEDRVTHFVRLGPVNALLNTLVHYFREPESSAVQQSWDALPQYLWDGEDGVMMNGYNATALWDTAFQVQAILATPHTEEHTDILKRAYTYIRSNQVVEELPYTKRFYRDRSLGGWGLGNKDNGWPVTDCTAEALKSALALEIYTNEPIPDDLLRAAVVRILSWQNRDGGWSTYEKQRGPAWLEKLNLSQVFFDMMVDYSYTECTSACIQALTKARQRFPNEYRIDRAVARGVRYIRTKQRNDGSWQGSWGVCFTYGTYFGVQGLLAAGISPKDPAIQKACEFLMAHQNPDGGWGEHYRSCTEHRYVPHPQSQVVQTAWALLTLTHAGYANSPQAQQAAQLLIQRQQADGDWPPEAMTGVFNKTILINYDNYRRYFPLWALARVQCMGEL
ncbi:MAG: terpene cyclase/mutase family protein [bacterium]|nr:terpene cyclase/mutase family protein [bacterium]